jgi:hypothetical protein
MIRLHHEKQEFCPNMKAVAAATKQKNQKNW